MKSWVRVLRRTGKDRRQPGMAVQGVLISSLVGMLSLVAGIALLPIVASSVGTAPYGLWIFLITLTSFFGYGDLGVYSAIVHFGSRTRAGVGQYSMSQLMTAGVVWSVLVAAVVVPIYVLLGWLFARSHAEILGMSDSTLMLLVALGGLVAGMAVTRPFSGAMIGAGQLLLDKRAHLVTLIFRVVGTLIAALGFKSIVAVAVVETIATALPSLMIIPYVLRHVAHLSFRRDALRPLGMMLGYSAKSLLTSIPLGVVVGGGTIILGLVQGPVQVTYFSLANRVASGLRTVLAWMLEPFRSALSRLAADDRDEHVRKARSLSFAAMSLIATSAGFIGVSAFWLVGIWVGDSMPVDVIATTVVIMMGGLVLESLVTPLILTGDTMGRPGVFLAPQVLWAALFLLLGPWLGGLWSSVGIAVAASVPLLVAGPWYLYVAWKRLDFSLGSWWAEAVLPTLTLVLPALALALVALWQCGQSFPWAPGAVFAAAGLATLFRIRHRLPIADLKSTLKVRM